MTEEKGYTKRVETKTFIENYHCPKCNQKMHYSGMSLMSNPPSYPHDCDCGYSERLRRVYPRTVHVEIESTDA